MEKKMNLFYETGTRGWKTWNVNSVLSYVYMPAGLTLSLCVREYRDGGYLRETLIGRQGKYFRDLTVSVIPTYVSGGVDLNGS